MAAKVKGLLQWCKHRCDGYRDVQVTNFTSSFKSGLAFCAIIHRFRPDLIDYDSLRKEDVYENNKLAFSVAQEKLGIAALLDAEDMVKMRVPDKLCIITYVSQYHNYFKDKEPATGGAIKRVAVKRPQLETNGTTEAQINKKPAPPKVLEEVDVKTTSGGLQRGPTYGDTCSMCKERVFLMERHLQDNKLYHRRCFREIERSQLSASLKRNLQASQALANEGKITEENKENIKKPRTSELNTYSAQVAEMARNQKAHQKPEEDIPNPFRTELQAKGLMYTKAASPVSSTYSRQVNGATAKTYTASDSSNKSSNNNFSQSGPSGQSSNAFLPYKSSLHSSSEKSQPPSFGISYANKLSNVKDDNVKQSLLNNLSKIRQEHSSSPSPQSNTQTTDKDNAKRKSALTVDLGKFPKKDTTKPSTSSHKVGLPSPTGYKSIFGDSKLSSTTSSAASDVKPILQSTTNNAGDQSRTQSRFVPKADTSNDSNPKSILKNDTNSRDFITNRYRNASPEGPRSILKSNLTDPPEKKGSSDRSTTPTRSILKSKSPCDIKENSQSKPGLSLSSHRSILKKSDDDSDIDLPRPILRKVSEDIDLDNLVEANLPSRPILKKHSIDKSDDEVPKPILKHVKEPEKPTWKQTRDNEKSKDAKGNDRLKNGVLDSSSEPLPEWQLEAQRRQAARGDQYDDPEDKKHLQTNGVQSGGQSGGQSHDQSGNQSRDRSSTSSTDRFLRSHGVFFDSSPSSKTDNVSSKPAEDPKSVVQPAKSSMLPAKDEPVKKINPFASKHTLYTPKISNLPSKDVGSSSAKSEVPSTKPFSTPISKPSATSSSKAGSTALNLLPKSNIDTNNSNNAAKNNWKTLEDTKKNSSSNVPDSKDSRPAWQIEAERRQAMRNGKYTDPEKDPAAVRNKLNSTEPKAPLNKLGTLGNKDNDSKPFTRPISSNLFEKNKPTNGYTGVNGNKTTSSATRPSDLTTNTNSDGYPKTGLGYKDGLKNDLNKDIGLKRNDLNLPGQSKRPYGSPNIGSTTPTKTAFSSSSGPQVNNLSKPTVYHTISITCDTADSTPRSKALGNTTDSRFKDSNNSSGSSVSASASSSSSPSQLSPVSVRSPSSTGYKSPFSFPNRTTSPLSPTSKIANTSTANSSSWVSYLPSTSPLASPTRSTTPNTTWSQSRPLSPSPAASPAPLPPRTDSPFSDKSSKSSPMSSPRSTPTSPSHKTLPGSNISYPTSYGASKLLTDSNTLPGQTTGSQFNSSGRDPAEKYRIATRRPVHSKTPSPSEDGKIYDNADRSQNLYHSMTRGSTARSNNHSQPSGSNNSSPVDTYSIGSFPRKTPTLNPAPGTSAFLSREPQRRKVGVDKPFMFARNEFDVPNPYSDVDSSSFRSYDSDAPDIPPRSYTMTGRPLPPVPRHDNRRRTISAEEHIPPEIILLRLESLDGQLRLLEEEGRQLEIKLRECEDEALENELLTAWFDLVNKKNGLVRDEVDLVYRQRQQELESAHEELEYELRLLLEKPNHMKTASDMVREDALLQELLHTVSERNSIIDSMEEDRLRYQEEDEVIAKIMKQKSAQGFRVLSAEEETDKKKSKKKKRKFKKKKPSKKKNKKDKDKGKEE